MLSTNVQVKRNASASTAVRVAQSDYRMDMASVGFEKSQDVIAEEATDTGQLLRSGFTPERLRDGTVQWGYSADYARAVDQGQAPHWPPIAPLKRWASRVLGDAALAWPVAHKIAREGTEGVHFVRKSMNTMSDWARTRDIGDYVIRRL